MDNSTKLMLIEKKLVNRTTAWLLFIFLGQGYGSLNKIGLQLLYYFMPIIFLVIRFFVPLYLPLTVIVCIIWFIVLLFRFNNMIKEYNNNILAKFDLSNEEIILLGGDLQQIKSQKSKEFDADEFIENTFVKEK